MQFTLPDSTVTQVAVADAKQVEVNGKSCTAFPCQVATKQLTDDIEARMVVNGKYGPVYTYTVKDYLNYLLEHDYPQQAKELASTLLVYGGKAQLYFGYRTDALAGTAEPNSTANWGSYQFESSGTQTDDYYGSGLLLEPVIQIRHYFMVPDGAECTFTFAWNAGEPETELQPVDTNTRFDGKEVYYVVTPAIAFRRADAMPVVAMRQNGVDLCTLRYGVFSYGDMVRALAAVDESQLPLLNLLRALDDRSGYIPSTSKMYAPPRVMAVMLACGRLGLRDAAERLMACFEHPESTDDTPICHPYIFDDREDVRFQFRSHAFAALM